MISPLIQWVFRIALVIIACFFIWSIKNRKKRSFLQVLYLFLAIAYGTWIIPLLLMSVVDQSNYDLMFLLDCATQPGGSISSPLYLCIAVSFVEGYESMRKWMKYLFVIPFVTVLVAFTNPLHHLQYQVFSVIRSEIVFGPYIYVSGVFNYACLIGAIAYMIRFTLKNKSNLYWKQCLLFTISGLCPLLVSAYATFSGKEISIAATPLSFMVTLVLNGIAIFRMHMLDITPIATQHILDGISDGYLVLSDSGLVLKYNEKFATLFAQKYGITENRKLQDCIKKEDITTHSPLYNMLTAVESCLQDCSLISYEQAVTVTQDNKAKKLYYVVDVSPLLFNNQLAGFAILFKDVTQLRDSMRKLQDSQERMMEQERFAFLGQMIGGLAHNLKTPIMSISGCIVATQALVDECEESLNDEQVSEEDFREIYGEIREWLQKVKDSTAYMSDIITAIKGQAVTISTDSNITFTIDEMLKRSMLLMRHELLKSGCHLKITKNEAEEISLQGDINNLVQVIGNLINNAIYAQQGTDNSEIEIEIKRNTEALLIMVKDRGAGISDNVMEKLFKTMVTSKGTMGTGLGLYISNAVIRSKFNGSMWGENRPDGGAILGISIPMDIVSTKPVRSEVNRR